GRCTDYRNRHRRFLPIVGSLLWVRLEHDPEKWKPVFGQDRAQTKESWRMIPKSGKRSSDEIMLKKGKFPFAPQPLYANCLSTMRFRRLAQTGHATQHFPSLRGTL